MNIESPVELTPAQIAAVGKTSTRKYKISPLVYRAYCWNALHANGRLLDYGCGKNPVHIPPHDNMEFVRYDICHFPKRPEGLFDDILVSNVLNVLPDKRTLVQTVGDIAGFLKPEGWVYVNFPSSIMSLGENSITTRCSASMPLPGWTNSTRRNASLSVTIGLPFSLI